MQVAESEEENQWLSGWQKSFLLWDRAYKTGTTVLILCPLCESILKLPRITRDRGKTLSSVTQRFSSPCRQGLLYPSLTSGLVVEKLYWWNFLIQSRFVTFLFYIHPDQINLMLYLLF